MQSKILDQIQLEPRTVEGSGDVILRGVLPAVFAEEGTTFSSIAAVPEILKEQAGKAVRAKLSQFLYGQQFEGLRDVRDTFGEFLSTVIPDLQRGALSHEKRQAFERALAALENSMR